jgi:hypothetical protein
MVLDTTHDEIEEKKPLDRESIITMVPEYVKEIYAHLREAEVCVLIINYKEDDYLDFLKI